MNEELNKKLAKWAGFGRHRIQFCDDRPPTEWTWELITDSGIVDLPELPDFTESLDACFKWLVPNIKHFHYIAVYIVRDAVGEPQPIMWDACVCTYEHIQFARAETSILALCLAIEKLIEVKDETK